jgi:Uncharacterized protein conserved in bacteria (DUF2188)
VERVHVFPHGGRWAVGRSLEEPPVSEYATREEAELAARGLAGHVEVHDTDPSGLEPEAPDQAGAPVPRPGVEPDDWERRPQAGL